MAVKKSKGHRSAFRRSLAGVITLASTALAACGDPLGDGVLDVGDAGGRSAGKVAVHTQATHLPTSIAEVSLSLGTLEATSDREPSSAARIALASPLDLDAPAPTSISSAPPATYGAVRLIAIDALTVTTTTGLSVRIELDQATPIDLRCAGPGTYLPVGGEIDLFVSLDFAGIQNALTVGGVYPPVLPLLTVTEPTIVANVFDALESGLVLDCSP